MEKIDEQKQSRIRKRILEKLWNIETYINKVVLERENETRGLIYAMLSGSSVFFIGDAGAAKTHHIEQICKMFSLKLFDTLMSETTKPEMIFGPVDVPALAQGVQRYKIDHYAPKAEVLFLDELFKANDVVLNPLLWLLNEKKFRNGDDGVVDCPLYAVFAASNEISSDKGLRPLYDRFLMRFRVNYIQTNKNLHKLLNMINGSDRPEIPEPISKKELDFLRRQVVKVEVPADVWQQMLTCRSAVQNAESIAISDRRMVQSLKVVQASAFMRGSLTAEKQDVSVLSNILWDTIDQSRKVKAIVNARVSTSSGEVDAVLQSAQGIFDKATKTGKISEGIAKLKNLLSSLKENKSALDTYRSVLNLFQMLKDVRENRKQIRILVIETSDEKPWFRLTAESQLNWTPEELRSCGFKQKREGYWWQLQTKLTTQQKLQTLIEKKLNTVVKFERLS
jgi:MoxR-like ATPase